MPRNLLIIGIGPHAQQNHLPVLATLQARGRLGQIIGFDITSANSHQQQRLSGVPDVIHYTSEQWGHKPNDEAAELPRSVAYELDRLVRRYHISGVIISCEPSYHSGYALWAIRKGLHTLLDKPTVMRLAASRDVGQARGILRDYNALADAYREARRSHPLIVSVVMCQRRYHPVYRYVLCLIDEVSARTGCSVTSMQSFHSDGQWRMPNELIDLSYHSFDRGYGKAAHSGYHFIDYLCTVISGGDPSRFDEVDLFANVTRPPDYLEQLGPGVHSRCFPCSSIYASADVLPHVALHGEVDAFVSLSFRRRGMAVALGSINLLHNGLSLRHKTAANPDLYRGNGRLRHESHIIEQGPFQAIYIRSYRSGDDHRGPHQVGGSAHLELEVFRNNKLFPDWKGYELVQVADNDSERQDQQAMARRNALEEFVRLVHGAQPPGSSLSDLLDHSLSSTLLAGIYQSMASRAEGGSPLVTVALP
jgi:predicted dehydrogenase